MTKPKVTTNPVANQYAGPNERIVEYSTRSGLGGLIALRETGDGLTVDLYRHDPKVKIRVGDTAPSGIPYKSHFTALFRALAACEAPEGTQVDGVLEEFQSTYDEAIGSLPEYARCSYCGAALHRVDAVSKWENEAGSPYCPTEGQQWHSAEPADDNEKG